MPRRAPARQCLDAAAPRPYTGGVKSTGTPAERRRRLALWLGFLAGHPEVLLDTAAAGGAAFLAFGALFWGAWTVLGPAVVGPKLSALRNVLILPLGVALFAAFAVAAGALCASAGARMQGRRLAPGELASIVRHIALSAPFMTGRRTEYEMRGAIFEIPALACEGLNGGQAVAVARDLKNAYAPMAAEVTATADEASGWSLLPIVLLGLAAGPAVIMVPSGADPYRWMFWHLGPVALAAVLFVLALGAALQVGAVAAYLYVTGDQGVRQRVSPLLPAVDTRRIPPPTEFQRERRESRETLHLIHELMTPLGKLKYFGPIALLPILIVWQYAPGLFNLPVRLLGTPVEAQVTSWREYRGECSVWFQFQAGPGYAPTVDQDVRRNICPGLTKYQKVRAHYFKFHPDTAALDDDGGKLTTDLLLLALLVLCFGGAVAAPFLLR